MEWSHGEHSVRYEEIVLSDDQADFAAWNLHRTATFMLAMVMKDAIKTAVPDLKNQQDSDAYAAYQISRLIRNAFAHNPFDPVWSIGPDCIGRVFTVRNIITLNTDGLQEKPFDWRQYGGRLPCFVWHIL
jgi:hypothetical protein